MFTVNLYTLSKRENSTKRPDSAPASFSCIIKEPSGLISPVIVLDLGDVSADPSGYNYAYIPAFGRYYFIEEWTFERAVWSASLTCDVLATYRGEIGDTTAYVLRAAAASDGNVTDNMYPLKTSTSVSRQAGTSPWASVLAAGNILGGSFVIGIVQKNASHGSIQYYAASASRMMTFTDRLMSNIVGGDNGFDPEDASFALQKALIDPFQFVKSCTWVPFPAGTAAGTNLETEVTVFDYSIGVNMNPFGLGSSGTITGSTSFGNIARHPQAASRGNYLNTRPFTEAELYFPPFGVIPIDTQLLASSPSITCNYKVDCITGGGILEVLIGGSVVNRLAAQIGVPIQLAQIRQDLLSSLTGSFSALGNAFLGNFMGAAAGIGNALAGFIPRANTQGSMGGWSDLIGQPVLNQYFHAVTDDDPDHAGRPLMQSRQLGSLPGYQLIQDGDIAIAGTAAEAAAVRAYLEGGYYYE